MSSSTGVNLIPAKSLLEEASENLILFGSANYVIIYIPNNMDIPMLSARLGNKYKIGSVSLFFNS